MVLISILAAILAAILWCNTHSLCLLRGRREAPGCQEKLQVHCVCVCACMCVCVCVWHIKERCSKRGETFRPRMCLGAVSWLLAPKSGYIQSFLETCHECRVQEIQSHRLNP